MATVYSSEVAVGTYNRIRIKCDYSGTSATLTVQFRRTSSYTGTWADSQANLAFNGQTKSAVYNYSGTVGTSWVDLRAAISGYTIPLAGGTYNWNFNNSGSSSVLGCSGTLTIPSQSNYPEPPTLSATVISDTEVVLVYGTTSFNDASGSVALRYSTTSGGPYTLIDSVTTTGQYSYVHTGLTPGATYYYISNSANTTLLSWSQEIAVTMVAPTIEPSPKIYGPVNNLTEKADKFYGSVNRSTKKILKIYGSENGQTKRIF